MLPVLQAFSGLFMFMLPCSSARPVALLASPMVSSLPGACVVLPTYTHILGCIATPCYLTYCSTTAPRPGPGSSSATLPPSSISNETGYSGGGVAQTFHILVESRTFGPAVSRAIVNASSAGGGDDGYDGDDDMAVTTTAAPAGSLLALLGVFVAGALGGVCVFHRRRRRRRRRHHHLAHSKPLIQLAESEDSGRRGGGGRGDKCEKEEEKKTKQNPVMGRNFKEIMQSGDSSSNVLLPPPLLPEVIVAPQDPLRLPALGGPLPVEPPSSSSPAGGENLAEEKGLMEEEEEEEEEDGELHDCFQWVENVLSSAKASRTPASTLTCPESPLTALSTPPSAAGTSLVGATAGESEDIMETQIRPPSENGTLLGAATEAEAAKKKTSEELVLAAWRLWRRNDLAPPPPSPRPSISSSGGEELIGFRPVYRKEAAVGATPTNGPEKDSIGHSSSSSECSTPPSPLPPLSLSNRGRPGGGDGSGWEEVPLFAEPPNREEDGDGEKEEEAATTAAAPSSTPPDAAAVALAQDGCEYEAEASPNGAACLPGVVGGAARTGFEVGRGTGEFHTEETGRQESPPKAAVDSTATHPRGFADRGGSGGAGGSQSSLRRSERKGVVKSYVHFFN